MKKFIASILTVALLFSCAGGLVSAAGEPAVKGSSSVVSDVSVDQFSFAQVNEQGITDFVTRMYQVCLGRKPDANGLKDWTGQLTGGKATGISVSFGFIFSKELQEKNVSNDEYIEIMYQAFFGRKSDPTGKQYWLDKMNGGMSRSDLFAGFANSKEFYDLCRSYGIIAGTYVPGQDRNRVAQVNLFVERLYNVVLGRTCDQTGMENWTNNLLKGKISGADAAYGFFFSPEYEGKRKTYTQYVTDLYNALMGRGPDDTGKGYWLNQMYAGTGSKEHVFNGFAQSNEFNGICTNYGIVRGGLISESRDTTYTLINDNPYGAGNNGNGGNGGNNGGNGGNGGNGSGGNGGNGGSGGSGTAVGDYANLTPEQTAKEYKYEIRPVFSPLNRMFYLKTDDPFVFDMELVDYSSVYYGKDSEPDVLTFCNYTFCDVAYENASAFRVKGGYLFKTSTSQTDGGELTVRINGEDTSVKINCPKVVDSVQYLIDTYGSKDKSFFENMDAVQSGLYSIAVYPRGIRNSADMLSPYPCYATSPYPELSLNLHVVEMFAYYEGHFMLSAVFPYILDSLGFPGMMSAVARRLAPDCTVERTGLHYMVKVTYKGESKSYGGAGAGNNDFIDLKDVTKLFKFDGSKNDFAANCSIELMAKTYSGYPREVLTKYKKMITDAFAALPNGTWIRTGTEALFGSAAVSYAYVARYYPDGKNFSVENVWVDGRYISTANRFVKGAHFSDFPTADIIVPSMAYKDRDGVSHTAPVYFVYDESSGTWIANQAWSNKDCWYGNETPTDDLVLTVDEVKALKVDRNTDKDITSGYIFDGTAVPGTKFNTSGSSGTSDKVILTAIDDKAFPDANARDWVKQYVDSDGDGKLSADERDATTYVVFSNITTSKGLEYFTEAQEIHLSGKDLKNVDVSKNTKVLLLDISGSGITKIDLSKNKALIKLELDSNALTALNVSALTELQYLSVNTNALTSLDLSKNKKLKYLSATGNQIKTLNFTDCMALELVFISNNQLSSLNVSKMKDLKELRCYHNNIKSIDISKNYYLKEAFTHGKIGSGWEKSYVIDSVKYEVTFSPLNFRIQVNDNMMSLNRGGSAMMLKGGYLINVDNAVKLYI